MITWNDTDTIANKMIDEQHKILFDLLDKNYTSYHFQ